jgi:stage II sporulation protein D
MNKSGGMTNVKVYNKKHKKYIKGPVSNIGKLKSIAVKERKSGGIVTKIIIKGTKNSICVEKQYTIRQMLAVSNQTIVKNNGKKVKGMTTLPSGFFKIKKKGNNYVISGGGYGHGVGMSQCGAMELAKRGYEYKKILRFYFKDVEI